MQKTRRQILDIIKRTGTATLEELAREIGLSPVTIRAHLSVLERDDLVTSEEVRGRVGRPHFVYSLAEGAEKHFPTAYHVIAHRFLDGFGCVAERGQMERVVDHVADRWAAERATRIAGRDLAERVAEAARIRTEEGAMAEWEKQNGGFLLLQYHCPSVKVAETHPEVCRAELGYISRLLSASVERVSCISSGDRCCTFRITA